MFQNEVEIWIYGPLNRKCFGCIHETMAFCLEVSCLHFCYVVTGACILKVFWTLCKTHPLFDSQVDHNMVLITCKVKTGAAAGDTDDSLITEGCSHPIGCFVCVWLNRI